MNDGFDVGQRLLELRRRAGLSQRALAARADVPHAQISQIESNRISPSIASLRRILGGLGLSMAAFFEPERAEPDQVFFGRDELTDLTSRLGASDHAGEPLIIMRQIGNALAHGLQVMHERYLPGADTGESLLEHAAHEGGFVLSGEVEITVGTQRRVLGPGEAYLFDSRLPHRFRNLGTAPAEVISACTPPYL